MLVLSRKIGEEIVVPDCQLSLKVLDVRGTSVKLGIAAPGERSIHRKEIWDRIQANCSSTRKEDAMRTRVLLVDPNDYLLSHYAEYLSQQGYEVFVSQNALDCIEKLRQYAPDIMVLEPTLPWGGGDGVLELMNNEEDIPKTPVLVLTHGTSPNVLYNISSYDISDFQKKPLSEAKLAERISQIIRRSRHERFGDAQQFI